MADELVALLQSLRGTFSLGLLTSALVRDPDTQALIHSHDVYILQTGTLHRKQGQPHGIPRNTPFYDVKVTGPGLPGDGDYQHLGTELSKMVLRNFTGDCFEAMKEYCEKSAQCQELYHQPWYQYARFVRNCFLHTQIWDFNDYDRTRLPVTWNGKTIDVTLQGTEITSNQYTWFDACQLYSEIYDFANGLR